MDLFMTYSFDEYFASGKEETISPFLKPSSQRFGKNLPLKSALCAAGCLLVAFVLSFQDSPLSSFFLLMTYFLVGTPALIGAIEDVANLDINIDVLMTLAALLSILIGSGLEGGLLLVLFELSAAMEEMASMKTKGTLVHLNSLSPRVALVVGPGHTLFEKAVKEIAIGTLLRVKPGEVVPLDGTIQEGNSFVNLMHLTGEAIPIPKKAGDEVPAGARNLDGSLTIVVTKTSRDSTLTKIIELITEAQSAKPKLQKILDHFGKWYAMSIIFLFFFFAAALPFFTGMPYLGVEGSIYRALAFLIAASPCALILATPTAYLSAISAIAKRGILLKGGVVLDALSKAAIVAFDKTGTLTTGKLRITKMTGVQTATSLDEALRVAYALELHSTHPIGDAIVRYAQDKKLTPYPLTDSQTIPGYGLTGHVGDKKVFIGSSDFIRSQLNSKNQEVPPALADESLQGPHAALLIGEDLFIFTFSDTVRPYVNGLMLKLKNTLHLRTLMLTGDHLSSAKRIAEEIGIDEVYAGLKPEDKLRTVEKLSQEKGLIMIGDGLNDAPALARATIGISMGKIGSGAAIDASDVVFLNDDLALLAPLIQKSRQTLRIVKQNITVALIVILFATTPALLGLVPLWVAVVLHEGGSVLVSLNSLRLLRR